MACASYGGVTICGWVPSVLKAGDLTQAGLEFYDSLRGHQIPSRTAADGSMIITGCFPAPLCNTTIQSDVPNSCPANATAASPPPGWSAVGPVTVTQGGDDGNTICLSSQATY